MVRLNEVRRNEVAVEAPKAFDAGLAFIGIIRTPWTSRLDCPRQGRADAAKMLNVSCAGPPGHANTGLPPHHRFPGPLGTVTLRGDRATAPIGIFVF